MKVIATGHPAPHYILQLLESAAMTMALLKTLHNPPSVSITAHSRDKRCSHHSFKAAEHYTEPNGNETSKFRMLTHARSRVSEKIHQVSRQLSDFVWGLGGASLYHDSGWKCRFAAVRDGSTGSITSEHFMTISSPIHFDAPNETDYDVRTLANTLLKTTEHLSTLLPLHNAEFLYLDDCQYLTRSGCRIQ